MCSLQLLHRTKQCLQICLTALRNHCRVQTEPVLVHVLSLLFLTSEAKDAIKHMAVDKTGHTVKCIGLSFWEYSYEDTPVKYVI